MQLSVLSLSLSENYTRAPQNDTWKMHFWCLLYIGIQCTKVNTRLLHRHG